MPYSDFIRVKRMEGELLLSQKRNRLGCTLTTRELIFQKPHTSYQVMLSDTLGILPFQLNPTGSMQRWDETGITSPFTQNYYRISASRIFIINRNGRFEREATDLLIPLSDRFIHHLQQHTDLVSIPTS
ncbi:hypothetical protein ACFQ49_10890 [Kroppenstedtia eburnea]|uniref:PH domain-containing protein n=1 Tax=Kroppenstedtia eburnea TaxID=714067 RepID=A0A1N7N975_9BACL|nr:hypothetical protein [Kroppenstedtia eburnea]EGK11638.1 hypothetical protein HMPREF9374_1882 [Desmospora sp. 8437]QKI83131.1 hypothetical protein GXN75_14630 [Kroppenstedtia eburnea]SIS94937.1 hypothetical protein SAMN05421790_10859 [Kroppenstedtia eburnea]